LWALLAGGAGSPLRPSRSPAARRGAQRLAVASGLSLQLQMWGKGWIQMVVGGKVKKPGKRGRKPAKIDLKAKLERSRQSARECRARKKLRYQYLEELVSSRERAICALREELEMYKQWCMAMDQGKIPSEIKALLTGEEQGKAQQNANKLAKAGKTEVNSSNP
ncbi:PREDICTED: cAMP-responsive element-binding protein-like 2, partial [Pterocles gutturalis]|uniref:cAMP-responsive element-binding protein-like 2 n=1 Tax=Pterocles gutturalis TaxID=240206 RepID=UPI000528CE70